MKRLNKINFTEVILLILVWIVLIASPVFFRQQDDISWNDFINPLRTLIPLFIIFLINRFLLVPTLFLKKKQLLYLFAVTAMIAVFTLGSYLMMPRKMMRKPQRVETRQRTPPPHLMHPGDKRPPPVPLERREGGPVAPFTNLLIFSVLLVGFDTGLMTSFRLAKSEREQAKLEKENAESQLAFLRNQVSPHFFMNTLNNIHSLIDLNTEEAKESIIRLSKLMRHLLYDSEIEKIPIQKEMTFIKNYVDLMRLRFSDKVKVNLTLLDKDQCPDKSIPPLLFTSYVENAFKHGISYHHPSFIDILFTVNENRLEFEIRNSNPRIDDGSVPSGIGIENSRKRLNLLYGDNYLLKIDETKDEYYVILSIPI